MFSSSYKPSFATITGKGDNPIHMFLCVVLAKNDRFLFDMLVFSPYEYVSFQDMEEKTIRPLAFEYTEGKGILVYMF